MRAKIIIALIISFLICLNIATAEDYKPIEQRYMETGENSNYLYIKTHRLNQNDYVGLSKNQKGEIHLAHNSEYIAKMFLVPAFKHPSNNRWYLCPLRNLNSVTANLYQDRIEWNGNNDITCYRYDDLSITGNANLTIKGDMTINQNGEIKITSNITIHGVSPTDTGFGYLIFPTDTNKYRYARIGSILEDLTGTEKNITLDKEIEFYNANQEYIKHSFDWNDMLDTGNRFLRIVTIGGNKGLLVGTYGYGASDNIYVDPIYSVDYSPIPAKYLINGSVNENKDSEFQTIQDVTTIVSDDIDNTTINPNKNKKIVEDKNILVMRFEEKSGTNLEDESGLKHDGTNTNGDLNIIGFKGSGIDLAGTNVNITIPDDINDFHIKSNEDFAICVAINPVNEGSTKKIIDKDSGIPDGFQVRIDSSEQIDFFADRGSGTTIDGTTDLATGQWHTFCGVSYANQTMQSWINNTFEGSATTSTGAMDSDDKWLFGHDWDGTGTQNYEGKIDEVCFWKGQNLDFTTIRNEYQKNGCLKKDNQTAFSGSWNATYESEYEWFLRLRKTSSEESKITVYGYQNNDSIITNQNKTQTLQGSGWFNINVSSILNYEKNIAGLNFTKLRFYSNTQATYSEVRLRKETNDTTPPNITNCQANTTTISCLETTKLICNATDNIDVDWVNFTINNTNHTTTKNLNTYTYILNPTFNGTEIYEWSEVKACDILGNCNTKNPNIQVNYTCIFEDYINITHYGILGIDQKNLTTNSIIIEWNTSNPSDSRVDYGQSPSNLSLSESDATDVISHQITLTNLTPNTTYYYSVISTANPTQTLSGFNFTTPTNCTENWIPQYGTCLINDTQLKTYYDNNSCGTNNSLPTDNGTYTYCNYCSEDLKQNIGECQPNNKQNITWTDNNYTTCCLITSLPTDCSILTHPYNTTTTQNCTYFLNQFTCTYDSTPVLNNKINVVCELPDNQSYCCVVNIYQDTNLLATTPEYKDATNSFLALRSEEETRECFTPRNRLLNAYYTKKELRPNTQYIMQVLCTTTYNGTTIKSEGFINPEYHQYDWLPHRLAQIGDRPVLALVTIVVLILLFLLAVWGIQKLRGR